MNTRSPGIEMLKIEIPKWKMQIWRNKLESNLITYNLAWLSKAITGINCYITEWNCGIYVLVGQKCCHLLRYRIIWVLPELNKLRLRQNRPELRLRPSGAQHYWWSYFSISLFCFVLFSSCSNTGPIKGCLLVELEGKQFRTDRLIAICSMINMF
jgi:hypothetical protein